MASAHSLFGILIVGIALSPVGDVHGQVIVSYRVDLAIMKQNLAKLKADTPVAIVVFNTDTLDGFRINAKGTREKVAISASSVISLESMKTAIRVKGVFRLEKALNSTAPALGSLNETIVQMVPQMRIYWDETYQRLWPLLPTLEKPGPVRVLAVWENKNSRVLDGTFLGPLTDDDVKELIETSEIMRKQPFAEMTLEESETLLDSGNQWSVYLGLARLQQLGKMSTRHWMRAIKALPIRNTESAIDEALWFTSVNKLQGEFTKDIADLLGKIGSQKEAALLKRINHRWQENPHTIANVVNLAQVQKAAQVYRTKIANDPQKREVVRELDVLIELRPKIN